MPDGALSTPTNTAVVSRLAKLREPFPPNQISKLPKESKAQTDERKANRSAGISCAVCGGWHHRNAVHLDYVGHAAMTDRLLDADIEWSWEPMAFAADGLPAFDRNGGLWIKLTVCGVTRLGFGSADGKSGGDAVKEIIGDALRNAAMRFGAALDLWHKGALHADEDDGAEQKPVETAVAEVDPREAWVNKQIAAMKTVASAVKLDHFVAAHKVTLEALAADQLAAFDRALADARRRLTGISPPKDQKPTLNLDDEIPY